MTENVELWWHDECYRRIWVRWTDAVNGLKWFEGEDDSKASHVTISELNASGWERVSNNITKFI